MKLSPIDHERATDVEIDGVESSIRNSYSFHDRLRLLTIEQRRAHEEYVEQLKRLALY